ncbi:MAG TPA: DNA-processing protein DprA [Ignavibacteria bacterium]|nr:DNA-processing protein DprA [Ignavibacteria bacterium]
MKKSEQFIYLYFLSKINRLGNVRILNILSSADTYEKLAGLSIRELRRIERIDEKIANEILKAQNHYKKFRSEAENLIEICAKKNINILTIFDEEYPANLRNIFDPPIVLYYRGKLTQEDKYSISIVGTRIATEYGKSVCSKLVDSLSKYEIPVISGFAKGIDSIAHKKCIDNGNLTYAVFGSGVDVVYPAENRKLYNEIIETGAVISEFEPGTGPEKVNFPKRNRLISGISLGTVIIETGIKGGSLITAEFALDQNRELFAVPGNVNSKQSQGTNDLIKKGTAKLINNVDDILAELQNKLKHKLENKSEKKEAIPAHVDLSKDEKTILSLLNSEPVNIDVINDKTGINISECLVHLLMLEFKGLVRQHPGKFFTRV